MTFREDAEAALRAGQNAEVGDVNPYAGEEFPALAKCWQRGYMTMLKTRTASTPAMQQYLQERGESDPSD